METLKRLHKNKPVRTILIVLLFLIIVLTAFQAGIFIGYQKATFSNGLGNRYYNETFEGGRHRGPMMGIFDENLPGGNGAVGKIVRIDNSTIVVATTDNIEKIILVTNDTLIRKYRDRIKMEDLKIGDQIVVIGSQNKEAKIDAKLIRLLPTPINENSTNAQLLKGSSTNQQ